MATKEQITHLAKMVKLARANHEKALQECTDFADEHSLSFDWDSTYGSTQQRYCGKGITDPEDQWRDSGCSSGEDDDKTLRVGKWISSSDSC